MDKQGVEFLRRERPLTVFLGRLVDKHGVRPDPEAVEAVLTWKANYLSRIR